MAEGEGDLEVVGRGQGGGLGPAQARPGRQHSTGPTTIQVPRKSSSSSLARNGPPSSHSLSSSSPSSQDSPETHLPARNGPESPHSLSSSSPSSSASQLSPQLAPRLMDEIPVSIDPSSPVASKVPPPHVQPTAMKSSSKPVAAPIQQAAQRVPVQQAPVQQAPAQTTEPPTHAPPAPVQPPSMQPPPPPVAASGGGACVRTTPVTNPATLKGPQNYHGLKQPPNRPGFGTKGRRMMVQTNFFPLKLPRQMMLYHYDVAMVPEKMPKNHCRKVGWCIV